MRKCKYILFFINFLLILLNAFYNIDSKYMIVNILLIILFLVLATSFLIEVIKNNKITFYSVIVIFFWIFSLLLAGKITFYYIVKYNEIIYIDEFVFPDDTGDRLILISYDSGGKSGPTEVIHENNYILTLKKSEVVKMSREYYKKFDLEKIYEEMIEKGIND